MSWEQYTVRGGYWDGAIRLNHPPDPIALHTPTYQKIVRTPPSFNVTFKSNILQFPI